MPFAPRVMPRGVSTPVMALCDKLQLHKDFVTFLVHAGAYRRVSTKGRVHLRNLGEMITALRALLIECHDYFSKAEAAIEGGDNIRWRKLAHVRQIVMTALKGASNNVTFVKMGMCATEELQSLLSNLMKHSHPAPGHT